MVEYAFSIAFHFSGMLTSLLNAIWLFSVQRNFRTRFIDQPDSRIFFIVQPNSRTCFIVQPNSSTRFFVELISWKVVLIPAKCENITQSSNCLHNKNISRSLFILCIGRGRSFQNSRFCHRFTCLFSELRTNEGLMRFCRIVFLFVYSNTETGTVTWTINTVRIGIYLRNAFEKIQFETTFKWWRWPSAD